MKNTFITPPFWEYNMCIIYKYKTVQRFMQKEEAVYGSL